MNGLNVIATFVNILVNVLFFAILIRAIMSWIMPNDSSGFTRTLNEITEPVLSPIRRVLPPVGGIDFSPLLAMVLLQVIGNAVVNLLARSV